MTFIYPSVLLLLISVPAAGGFLIWRSAQKQRLLRKIVSQQTAQVMLGGFTDTQDRLKLALWLTSFSMLIIALARPQWGTELIVNEVYDSSVFIVIDVSRSMLAEDIQPSRLERARLDAREILEAYKGDAGVISFAGAAYIQFPLTSDSSSAVIFLNAVDPDAISQQGTAIEAAIRLAIRSFPQHQQDRTIILLSDGENHEGNAEDAAKDAAAAGITIHVIGYGQDQGEEIPNRDAQGEIVGYHEDSGGQLVLSRIDEPLLQSVANAGNGTYQRATSSGYEAANVIAAIQGSNEMSAQRTGTQIRSVERYGVFVLLAILTLSVEMLLPKARRSV